MATELEELVEFLSSPSPQLRKAAIDIVRGLTGSNEGIQTLASHSSLALPPLSRLLQDSSPDISSASADALINLSQVSDLASKLVSLGIVGASMEVMHKRTELSRKLVMLLVNLTQVEVGVSALLQVGDEKMEGLYVAKLVRSFTWSSSAESSEDAFEHVASILVNISKSEAGRRVLLDPKRALLKQVVRQSDSTNPIRKKGVCGTIRNCCFEADNQLQNLLIISEYLWPALLLPVSGKKIYSDEDRSKMPPELSNALSHEREVEEDPEIRKQSLEAIYMISMLEAGRKALWAVNGPRILQVGYEDEEDPKVMEAYEQIGSLLVDNDGAE
ncbi:ARM repeat superfamily protein [Carex rostrata]